MPTARRCLRRPRPSPRWSMGIATCMSTRSSRGLRPITLPRPTHTTACGATWPPFRPMLSTTRCIAGWAPRAAGSAVRSCSRAATARSTTMPRSSRAKVHLSSRRTRRTTTPRPRPLGTTTGHVAPRRAVQSRSIRAPTTNPMRTSTRARIRTGRGRVWTTPWA